jgi:hypothetical protein
LASQLQNITFSENLSCIKICGTLFGDHFGEGWTISPTTRETVPIQAEMLYPHKVKEKCLLQRLQPSNKSIHPSGNEIFAKKRKG